MFLRDKDIELKPRINATKTWIVGKIMHLCETWPALVQAELKYLPTKFVKIFKVVLPCDFASDDKMSFPILRFWKGLLAFLLGFLLVVGVWVSWPSYCILDSIM